MRLHSSLLLALPGISLAAELGSQSYETLENTPTYYEAPAMTGSMEAEGFSVTETQESNVEQVNAENEGADRPDWRKKLRSRGQCDATTSNNFTVSGSEDTAQAEKVPEGESYATSEEQGYGEPSDLMNT